MAANQISAHSKLPRKAGIRSTISTSTQKTVNGSSSGTWWERLAVPYKPQNMIDLNWKIHFLATIGREKYASQLNELIDQLYSFRTAGRDLAVHV